MKLFMRRQPKRAKHSSHVMKSGSCPNHVQRTSCCAPWVTVMGLEETLSISRVTFECLLHLRGSRDKELSYFVSALAMPQLASMHAVRSPLGLILSHRSKRRLSTDQPTRTQRPQRPRRRDLLPRRSTAPQRSGAETALLKGKAATYLHCADSSAVDVLCGTQASKMLQQGLVMPETMPLAAEDALLCKGREGLRALLCLLRAFSKETHSHDAVCHHRLASLKEVIIPGREKEDQAGFLISAATYIRQLQVDCSFDS